MTRGALLDTAAMYALHGVAWVALRIQSPRRARRTVAFVGARLPPYAEIDDARAAARRLSRTGSCLSRSLAIAARLPGAEVVIGVDPRRSARLTAHAWVEIGDAIVDGAAQPMHDGAIARL